MKKRFFLFFLHGLLFGACYAQHSLETQEQPKKQDIQQDILEDLQLLKVNFDPDKISPLLQVSSHILLNTPEPLIYSAWSNLARIAVSLPVALCSLGSIKKSWHVSKLSYTSPRESLVYAVKSGILLVPAYAMGVTLASGALVALSAHQLYKSVTGLYHNTTCRTKLATLKHTLTKHMHTCTAWFTSISKSSI